MNQSSDAAGKTAAKGKTRPGNLGAVMRCHINQQTRRIQRTGGPQ
jgi:hypothetical protein